MYGRYLPSGYPPAVSPTGGSSSNSQSPPPMSDAIYPRTGKVALTLGINVLTSVA